jgi:two-component system cell cycle response regulator
MADKTEFKTGAEPLIDEGAIDGKRPCLIMVRGDFVGQIYELTKDVTWLGRSDQVDLVVADTSISRKHAMVVHRADGFYVSDLDSTNGTQVNRETVAVPTRLREGDKIRVGNVIFKFSYQDDDDTHYHMLLRNMAVKDGLTRAYNKRYFQEVMEKEFEYNRRNKSGLALVMFDIDHFKTVNDTHGHPAGDAVLKQLAELIEFEARGYDLFARVGGEEFVFLMRAGTLVSAIALAERVRNVVAEHAFFYDELCLRITVSLGVAYWSGDGRFEDVDGFVNAADQQLYRAKHGGRNRTCHLEP